MVELNLVGRCGLYCGACGIYRAYKDGGEYLQKVADYFKISPEKVRCEGCQVLTPNCWGNDCKIVQCLNAKNFQFCYQCPEYNTHNCEEFEKLAQRYLNDNVDLRANLARIKAGETEAWLKEMNRRFRCPNCGKPLPVSRINKRCYHCKTDLSP